MKCEACVSVVVYIVTGFPSMIFYGAGDILSQICLRVLNIMIMYKFKLAYEA